ncbi:MAG: thiamine phosphate synthase [Thermoguttaceae bacterium]|jgi:thiamine-phosphate pyrophosphorylase
MTPTNVDTPDGSRSGDAVGALRVIDAAANRAREGLRVVEDYVRFVLDDGHLTGLCKQLRHDLAAAVGQVSLAGRLAARQTEADVGTHISTPTERRRDDLAGLLTANCLRVEEALRSLEEFGKLVNPEVAAGFEQLRYRAYTLHRAIETTRWSLDRLERSSLCVILDGRSSLSEFETLVRQVIEAGADMIQLRDKRLDDRRLIERGRVLRELAHGTPALAGTRALVVVNDRPDLAALVRADGVHLGQEDLSVKDARAIVGPEALIGVSTHSPEQARAAVLDGANYLGVGPTFPSGTKSFDRFPGLDLLRAVAAEICLPAFAIGGITSKNLPQVTATGFRRIAVQGAITSATDPERATAELVAALKATEFH